jgi:hypothetical protein
MPTWRHHRRVGTRHAAEDAHAVLVRRRGLQGALCIRCAEQTKASAEAREPRAMARRLRQVLLCVGARKRRRGKARRRVPQLPSSEHQVGNGSPGQLPARRDEATIRATSASDARAVRDDGKAVLSGRCQVSGIGCCGFAAMHKVGQTMRKGGAVARTYLLLHKVECGRKRRRAGCTGDRDELNAAQQHRQRRRAASVQVAQGDED